jgi:predicted dienelactone hydrolase
VGHTIKTLNVPGSLDPTTLTSNENRPIQVQVWYPARDQDDCDEAAGLEGGPGGCHAPLAVYTSRLHGMPLLPQWSPLAWTITASLAFENPRIAEGDERFPVIIFSHGNGNDAFDHVYLLETLASYGYVVAAPDHLNNTQDDVRIDFANTTAVAKGLIAPGQNVLACLDGLPSWTTGTPPVYVPCSRPSVSKSMVDRFHDVEAVLDALPTWFGHRADMKRVGIMGHSRGSVTSLALAGGSSSWGAAENVPFPPDGRIKAVMGLSIGTLPITEGVDLENVTAPTLLVSGLLDKTGPLFVTTTAFSKLASADKQVVTIPDAVHRHFDSAYCAEMQSSGAIAQANAKAVLDRQTLSQVLHNPNAPLSGDAKDFCAYDSFTDPTDITSIVDSIYATLYPTLTPPFTVTPSDVPTHGLTTDMVKDQVVDLAVSFFGRVLECADDPD